MKIHYPKTRHTCSMFRIFRPFELVQIFTSNCCRKKKVRKGKNSKIAEWKVVCKKKPWRQLMCIIRCEATSTDNFVRPSVIKVTRRSTIDTTEYLFNDKQVMFEVKLILYSYQSKYSHCRGDAYKIIIAFHVNF